MNNEFESVIDSSYFFHLDVNTKDTNMIPSMIEIIENWKLARDWVIKKEWKSNWKIQCSKFKREAIKSRGILLLNYYKLCERCHAMQDCTDISLPYKNAGILFSKIFVELIGIEVDSALNKPKVYNGNIKKALLDLERNKSKKLRKGVNPFVPYVVNEAETEVSFKAEGLHKLIEVALKLKDKSDVFKKDYWNPFLSSYSTHIKELESDRWGCGFVDPKTGKYYVQGGRGRGGNGRMFYGTTEDYKKLIFKILT